MIERTLSSADTVASDLIVKETLTIQNHGPGRDKSRQYWRWILYKPQSATWGKELHRKAGPKRNA